MRFIVTNINLEKKENMRRPPSPSQLKKTVEQFNAKFPVGTAVILCKDSGEVQTKVRAPAEIMGGHSAVGWFEGVSGAYSIEHNRVSSPNT